MPSVTQSWRSPATVPQEIKSNKLGDFTVTKEANSLRKNEKRPEKSYGGSENTAKENNTALYGNFIASGVHSLFLLEGSTEFQIDDAPSLSLENKGSYYERINQQSGAKPWDPISAGKTPCIHCNVDSKKQYIID